jgi:S-DNA-T family DNA segregation ATPase FtsK/SpoIIIE
MKENRPKRNKPQNTKTNRGTTNFPFKLRKVIGLFLMLLSLFLIVAMLSHMFFSGIEDQSAIETNSEQDAENKGGYFGAMLASLFITKGFGYISLLFPFYLFLLGYALMENKFWELVAKLLSYLIFALLWVSTCLGFLVIVFNINAIDPAGYVGLTINELLIKVIGFAGTGLLIIFSLLTFLIFKYNFYFNFFDWFNPFAKYFDKKFQNTTEILSKLKNNKNNDFRDKINNTEKDEETKTEDEAVIVSVRKTRENNIPNTDLTDREKKNDAPIQTFAPAFTIEHPNPDPVLEPYLAVLSENSNQKTKNVKFSNSGIAATDDTKKSDYSKATQKEAHHLELIIEKNASIHEDNLYLEQKSLESDFVSANGDNIYQVEREIFARVIPKPDQELLLEGDDVGEWEAYDPKKDLSDYRYPQIDLLKHYENPGWEVNKHELESNKNQIVKTLQDYGIEITSIKATIGPTVTLYEIVPAAGVRISKIKNLEDDIALNLAALGIRIIAPMPGKGTIGIEIPNSTPEVVSFRSILATEKFRNTDAELPIAIGKTIANEVFVADLTKMPHLLVAGATGQGKSVGLNCIIASILYKKHPAQVKFVLIDPKKVEMTLYQALENHFLAKLPDMDDAIITDNKQVVHVLNSLCKEMDNRYGKLNLARSRNITEYNDKFINRKLNPRKGHEYLPYIVLIIDELADLMMTSGKETETPIARLAQLGRACGIHLVVATQRPSVNVITGIIKANFTARISYRVTSKTDSRTILDSNGAERLIGRGDLLFYNGSDIIRLQNAFIDTPEVERLVDFIASQRGYPEPFYLPEISLEDAGEDKPNFSPEDRDPLFEDAARLIVSLQQGSTSIIQRRMKLGYNRAGRIMDQLEQAGIVGPASGSKPRDVLITEFELERILLRGI